ncbi:MAG: hypothetical protein J5726_06075 [Treponema sp.]|nr:hypothetical protein [Treponema sp.]
MTKIKLLTLTFCSILICGCSLFTTGTTPQKTTVTVNTSGTGHVYLVKTNTSTQKTIQGRNTGSIESVVSRSAGVDELELSALREDLFIQKQNEEIREALSRISDGARSAGDNVDLNHIGTGYSSLNYSKGDSAQFYSFSEGIANGNMLEGISHLLNATCYYAGEHCYVFGDDSEKNGAKKNQGIDLNYSSYSTDATESENSFFKLGKIFDECYELETSIIGDPTYENYHDNIFIPCNKKIIIFVSDLYGDAKEGQDSGVVGYFYNGDMYKKSFMNNYVNIDDNGKPISEFVYDNKGNLQPNTNFKNTNEMAMFYVDSNFLTNCPENVYTTLVHEFNHMINYVVKTLNYSTTHNKIRSLDQWFTELLAMVTEDMFCSYLETPYNYSPMSRLPLFNLFYNYGFTNWKSYTVAGTNGLDSLYVSYANTYAFGAYLARNYGGVDLIKEIATSDYINKDAIDRALKNRGSSYDEALGNFPLVIINTAKPNSTQLAQPLTSEKYYFSLNRSAKKTGDELFFDAIEIGKLKLGDQTYAPRIFKKAETVDLGPQGFSVHYVGYNIKSFELTANVSDLMDYYLVE